MDKWVIVIMAMVAVLLFGGFLGFKTLNDVNKTGCDTVAIADNAVPYGVASNQATLTVETEGYGSVGTIPFKEGYQCGDQVKLTALALDGWVFDHWELCASGQEESTVITLKTGTNRVKAVFRKE